MRIPGGVLINPGDDDVGSYVPWAAEGLEPDPLLGWLKDWSYKSPYGPPLDIPEGLPQPPLLNEWEKPHPYLPNNLWQDPILRSQQPPMLPIPNVDPTQQVPIRPYTPETTFAQEMARKGVPPADAPISSWEDYYKELLRTNIF